MKHNDIDYENDCLRKEVRNLRKALNEISFSGLYPQNISKTEKSACESSDMAIPRFSMCLPEPADRLDSTAQSPGFGQDAQQYFCAKIAELRDSLHQRSPVESVTRPILSPVHSDYSNLPKSQNQSDDFGQAISKMKSQISNCSYTTSSIPVKEVTANRNSSNLTVSWGKSQRILKKGSKASSRVSSSRGTFSLTSSTRSTFAKTKKSQVIKNNKIMCAECLSLLHRGFSTKGCRHCKKNYFHPQSLI